VCFVNTHDIVGGAERCSFDLMTGLRDRGHAVSLVVGRKFSDDPDVYQCVYPAWDWKPRAFLNYRLGLTETTLATPLRWVASHPAFCTADIVNLHNMHGSYWNFWTLPLESWRKPVVLTLHDEWFLTGDCAYTYNCERWLKSCGNCPQFAWEVRPALGGRDFTRANMWLKRAAAKVTRGERLTLVTPSTWLTQRVRSAPHLSRFECVTIPYGIDTDLFQPGNKQKAKARFGLPAEKFCFLFFAHDLSDPRKGVRSLERALEAHGLPANSVLMLAGKGGGELAIKFPELPIVSLGYLREKTEIAACLSAADCMLLLSEADNLPYAGIEAIACGCPLLARDVGGISEIVQPGVSGVLLCVDATPDALAAQMTKFAGMPSAELQALSRRARQFALERFSKDPFLNRYEALFEEQTARHRPATARHRRTEAPWQPMNADKFEKDIVAYALNPQNQDRFAQLLNSILPAYVKSGWGQNSVYRRSFNEWQRHGFNLAPNHYYSAIPDVSSLSDSVLSSTSEMIGLDIGEDRQMTLLDTLTTYKDEYSRFPEGNAEQPHDFYFRNGVFERVDAEVLYAMVRYFKPRHIIEIGAGFSTLISAAACEANRRETGEACEFVAVEPFPNDLFRSPIPGLTRLLKQPLQRTPLEFFDILGENDILFIDSSHILKIGSDVQYEYTEILPRLHPGVIVHVHDIFLPAEYPKQWIRDEHIFWNEQYLLQAFLSFNTSFEVLWAGSFMHRKHPEKLEQSFPGYQRAICLPGSFWMRRKN
jgi:glycosyltransferase involved in cell wall biosynthesis